MTNKKIATKIAKRLVAYLSAKGIATKCDYKYLPIEKILRGSWYVTKVKETGHTDCIYIDVKCGGFFAVLENGEIMTGQNCMIADAVSNIIYELFGTPDYDKFMNVLKIYTESNYEEDALLIGSLDKIKFLIDTYGNWNEYNMAEEIEYNHQF